MISGKEALIALVDGGDVLYIGKGCENKPDGSWGNAKEVEADDFLNDAWSFKLKQKTITLNGIEVPAPFEPKEGDGQYYSLDTNDECGYSVGYNMSHESLYFGAWRTEEEIKQVVEALRNVFNP